MKKEKKDSSLTPVMRQYRSVKERYPDAVLLFRMGDFYEMFYDDAVLASKVLGIVLTTRDRNKENPVPMAGVPYHSVTTYLKKLLDAGYRAAVCEQLEEPSRGKPIVARDVVRIITPGVNLDTELLEAKESNYLMAVTGDPPGAVHPPFGVAVADISTGRMMAAAVEDMSMLASQLVRFEPKEVLLPSGSGELEESVKERLPGAAVTTCRYFHEYSDYTIALKKIDEATDEGGEGGAGRSGLFAPLPAAACASVLEYLARTQPGSPLPVRRISVYKPSQFMILDETTVRHLELTVSSSGDKKGSLLWLIDRTVTPMGSRLLRSWLLSPLMDISSIRRRQDVVQFFIDDYKARQEARKLLGRMSDVERIVSRCIVKAVTPKELGALRDTLGLVPDLAGLLASSGFEERAGKEREVLGSFPEVPADLSGLLERALVSSPPANAREGGIFAKGYDEELDRLAYLSVSGKEAIAALEAEERKSTGIGTLKVKYNKVFGYFIEVTKSNLHLVPKERYSRKQTIAGGERYVTEELKDLESRILTADERRKALESELFTSLVREVTDRERRLHAIASFTAATDVTSALAEHAAACGYSRPHVDGGSVIRLRDARHPVVEEVGAPDGFVPNDVNVDMDGERVWIITGPNMSGKSTFMRQTALCVILAQMGSFIPASEATVGLCDRIFTRVGASDNLAWGQSTFMVEMTETAAILGHATPRSLVVLDEIGRGTSTYDGMSIAWATAEYLHEKVGCRTLMATHYHELTRLASIFPGIANYNVSATEFGDKIVFLRKVTRGGSSRSYGIQVARLAGVPEEVIRRAGEILRGIESEGEGRVGLDEEAAAGGPGRSAGAGGAQLDLFASSSDEKKYREVRRMLEGFETERTTPLEAMSLLARLKGLL